MAMPKAKEVVSSNSVVVLAMPKAKELVSSNSVVVFSKSYCPYCVSVKKLLSDLGVSFKAIELDEEGTIHGTVVMVSDFFHYFHTSGAADGDEIQSALAQWTGQRTVPNVFIGGNHIGGCDKTTAMHKEGNLVPLLTEAGALTKAA